MKKMWKGYQQHREAVLSLLGLLAVSLIALPYLVLGEGSYVQIHDQLDGEVLNYMYQARYLGQGSVIPEFMNGMDKASMLPPAPLGVLLYRVLPPFAAYAAMHWLCLIAGFLGMYSLGKRLGMRAEVSWAMACLFCYIPLYPVYGLAALGQPMLVLCGLGLRDGRAPGALWKTGGCILGIALFAASSSLTLVGYVWVAAGILWTVYLAVAGRKKRGISPALRVGGGTLTLFCVYLATNRDLLRSLTGDGFTTHRQEMALRAAEHPLETFKELILNGGSYSPVYSAGILAAAVLLTLGVLVMSGRDSMPLSGRDGRERKSEARRGTGPERACGDGKERGRSENPAEGYVRSVWRMIGLIAVAALLAALWNSAPVVSLRLAVGGMVTYFQADRVYWCFPFLWMLALGLILEGICRLGERPHAFLLPLLCCLLLVGAEGLQMFRDSTLNKNIRLMLLADYRQVTWESIFMEDVFARIDRVIGEDKGDYSVASLGLYPSVALYHGYTCADGYSNNYDLEYKHRFRRIMAAELEENEEARRYFDEWGNRLYLAGAPYGINGMVAKGQSGYVGLDYDLEAMRSLNIRYLLAAAPVELSAASLERTSLRLELVEGSPFTDDTAYYEIWVYRLD